MKKLFSIIFIWFVISMVCFSVVGDQQLLHYAKKNNVIAQMDMAGSSNKLEGACRSLRLPWFARYSETLTPLAFTSLILLVLLFIFRNKLKLGKIEKIIAVVVALIGFPTLVVYLFVNPFYPFSLCRGWLI